MKYIYNIGGSIFYKELDVRIFYRR